MGWVSPEIEGDQHFGREICRCYSEAFKLDWQGRGSQSRKKAGKTFGETPAVTESLAGMARKIN